MLSKLAGHQTRHIEERHMESNPERWQERLLAEREMNRHRKPMRMTTFFKRQALAFVMRPVMTVFAAFSMLYVAGAFVVDGLRWVIRGRHAG
jgi:hypothetical protein